MKGIQVSANIAALLLMALSASAAPLQQGSKEKETSAAVTHNEDNTAKELEELTKSDHAVVMPAAPVVAKVTQNGPAETDEQPQTGFLQDAPQMARVASSPIKRQFQMPSLPSDAFPAETDRFPIFSPDQEDESAPSELYPRQPEIDLSPRAVAEYLLVTTDFDGFEQAMSDLMNIGVLSSAEVLQYKESVSWEYENLLRQMAQAESQYLQELSRVSPMDYFNTVQQPVRTYPEYPFNQNSLEYPETDPALTYRQQLIDSQGYPRQMDDYREQMDQANIQEMLSDKKKTLDDVLNLVLNEYFGNQQQDADVTEYDVDVPEELQQGEEGALPSYEPTNDADEDMNQFMAYLQHTLTSEVAGAGIIEIPEKSDLEKVEHEDKAEQTGAADVAQELDDLSGSEESNEIEENSGEIDTNMKPEIQSASS